MAVGTYNKFNETIVYLGKGIPNMTSGATCSFKVMLTNSAPSASNTVKGDITEISAGNGYSAGGASCSFTSWSQSSGVAKLILADPPTWTASGGSIGPFRYAVLYDDFAATKPLIAYWDYGSSQTLAVGETFTVDLDQTNGVFTIT